MKHFLLISIMISLLGCKGFQSKEGDFLFQDIDCGPMCEAIEAVTQGKNNANFSHIGLVVKQGDGLNVLEALSDGVILTPYNEFLNRSVDNEHKPKAVVGRLKRKYRKLIPTAIEESLKLLGKPYNDEFLMGEDKYYCSQLIYEVFKTSNSGKEIFELQPMTFKEPNSDNFFPIWVEYYKALGIEIPEGEPGINPGGISRSSFIKIIHTYGKVSGWEE